MPLADPPRLTISVPPLDSSTGLRAVPPDRTVRMPPLSTRMPPLLWPPET